MIDIKNKRCEAEGCNKINPAFDITGGTGRFCVKHKLSNMINIKGKRCEAEGCDKITPIYDIPGGTGRFCLKHKKPGMVDIKHIKCKYMDCNTRAYYGHPGNRVTYCTRHRLPGMIRRPNGKCKSDNCKEPAIYGLNYIPTHCESHKHPDQQNYIERECKSCNLIMTLNKDNLCEYCNPIGFEIARLAKQRAVMAYLDNKGLYGSSTDTIIDGGICGKERPDRVFDFGDKIIIFECDEHQHRDRACECEQTRMVNIGQMFGGIPVYFIRWNPDDYTPTSPQKGPEPIQKRYSLLADLLQSIKDNRYTLPNGLISAIYMYYDDWDNLNNTEWNIITKFD